MKDFHNSVMYDRIVRKRTRYTDMYEDVEAKFSVMERAERVLSQLENEHPYFLKCMLPSNVSHGFWLVRFQEFVLFVQQFEQARRRALCANFSCGSIFRKSSAAFIYPITIALLCWWMNGEMSTIHLIFLGGMV